MHRARPAVAAALAVLLSAAAAGAAAAVTAPPTAEPAAGDTLSVEPDPGADGQGDATGVPPTPSDVEAPRPQPSPATAPPPTVTVRGRVVTADGDPVAGAHVALTDGSGSTVQSDVTGADGRFRLAAPPWATRLLVTSGDRDRSAQGLPGRFRLSADLTRRDDGPLRLRLPRAYRTTVVATDGNGRPVPGAVVSADAETPLRAAPLWAGGSLVTGTQRPAPAPLTTGPDGRAEVWAFPTPDLGPLAVTPAGAPTTAAATLTGLDVTGDQTAVAVPGRPACVPRRPSRDLGPGDTTLVADLDATTVRESPARAALLQSADAIVAGGIPAVAYNATLSGDPKRYLYDEGVALRRITGILGYAYAATKDPRYLDTMAATVALNAARWPDWNPGHPLDTAQVATAVALAYAWSGHRLAPGDRAVVADALTSRMLLAYSCADGSLGATRSWGGNRSTVVATAAALSAIAVRNDAPAWASVALDDATAALRRAARDTASGRSVTTGPTVEGFMYTAYEAANLALLHATRWRSPDRSLAARLGSSLADLQSLAAWTERCGRVADPPMDDGWDIYPWVDRPTAVAAVLAWPPAGGHSADLLAALQERATLTVPDRGSWAVPDGIAEIVVSGLSPRQHRLPPAGAVTSGGATPRWGCAASGALQAVLGAAPNNAPHAHRDVGNVVVSAGDQDVLTDLGQRDYGLRGVPYVWRALTKAHSTLGVLQPDGRVEQGAEASGTVTTDGASLTMTSGDALPGLDWRRSVSVTDTAATIRDELRLQPGAVATTVSMSFLLATAPGRVTPAPDGRLRFTLPDGSVWELVPPAGATPSVRDASPTPPYDDAPDVTTRLGPAHSLVTIPVTVTAGADLTTTVTRVGHSGDGTGPTPPKG